MALLGARFVTESLVNVLEHVSRPNIKGIAKPVDHPKTRTAFPKFDQRDVVAIDGSTQGQICLAPFAFGTEAAKCLPECLIYVQVLAQ